MPVTIGSLYIQFPKSQPEWLARFRRKIARYRRGIAYARGRLTRDQALEMGWEIDMIAGVYPLECLDAETVLETAREYYEDTPELEDAVHSACLYVAKKWDGDTQFARDYALEQIEEMAHRNGATLIRRNPAVVKRYG